MRMRQPSPHTGAADEPAVLDLSGGAQPLPIGGGFTGKRQHPHDRGRDLQQREIEIWIARDEHCGKREQQTGSEN